MKLRGTMNAAAKKRLAVWKRLCWAASHSTQDASSSPGIREVTTETFVSFARLISDGTSEVSAGDVDEFQKASVQTVNSVKLSAGLLAAVITSALDVPRMSSRVTATPPPPVSWSTPSDSAGRKKVLDIMVTSLLPTSVGVDVFGTFSITDHVKNLQQTKSDRRLTNTL